MSGSDPSDPVVACVLESLRHHDQHVPKARKAAEEVVAVLRKMGHLTPPAGHCGRHSVYEVCRDCVTDA